MLDWLGPITTDILAATTKTYFLSIVLGCSNQALLSVRKSSFELEYFRSLVRRGHNYIAQAEPVGSSSAVRSASKQGHRTGAPASRAGQDPSGTGREGRDR